MIIKAIEPVFLNGVIVEKGSIIACPNDYAEKLIDNKSAIEVKENIETKTSKSKKKTVNSSEDNKQVETNEELTEE